MTRTALLVALICLVSTSAVALSPAADEAVKTLSEIEADKGKLDPYCALLGEMTAAGTDQTKLDALGERFDTLMRSFGPKFGAALDLHVELDDASPDGAAMIAAFQKLDGLCGK